VIAIEIEIEELRRRRNQIQFVETFEGGRHLDSDDRAALQGIRERIGRKIDERLNEWRNFLNGRVPRK